MGNQELNQPKSEYTAGIIIIGNEILSGRTLDQNVQYMGERLSAKGVILSEVVIIPDIESRIIEAAQSYSERFDYVFTTGGIGPTHDDITAESVGKAFGAELMEHPDARARLEAHYEAHELTDARLKMAKVPVGSDLIGNPVSGAPGFRLKNVHVMAGIPKIMQAMFDSILPELAGGDPVLSESVSCFLPESELAGELSDIQRDYPDLDIGSYPFFKDGHHGLSVVIRGTDIGMIQNAAIKVQDAIERVKQTAQNKY